MTPAFYCKVESTERLDHHTMQWLKLNFTQTQNIARSLYSMRQGPPLLSGEARFLNKSFSTIKLK